MLLFKCIFRECIIDECGGLLLVEVGREDKFGVVYDKGVINKER